MKQVADSCAEMASKCPICGTTIVEGAAFCGHCGWRVGTTIAQSPVYSVPIVIAGVLAGSLAGYAVFPMMHYMPSSCWIVLLYGLGAGIVLFFLLGQRLFPVGIRRFLEPLSVPFACAYYVVVLIVFLLLI